MPKDRTALIEKLNEIVRWEYAGLIQYTQFSFVVRGPLREVYHEFFRENGEEALGHAHKIGDKVVIMEFPDAEAAREFQESPEYQAIAEDRKAGADAVVLTVRGLKHDRPSS